MKLLPTWITFLMVFLPLVALVAALAIVIVQRNGYRDELEVCQKSKVQHQEKWKSAALEEIAFDLRHLKKICGERIPK